MKNILKYIPVGAFGQIIGTAVVFPLIVYLINILYYPNKYNNDAELYYKDYIRSSYNINILMPPNDSKYYLHNVDKEAKLGEFFRTKMDDNIFSHPEALYIQFYSVEYKKYFNIMFFTNLNDMWWPYGMKVILTVNRDDMNNPSYGTKENPVPVLKDIGVDESLRDNDKDYDKAYMDSFYRKNVIRYLKYKMPKEEFKRRFLDKTN